MEDDFEWYDAYYGTTYTENDYVPQDTSNTNADGSPAEQDPADLVDAAAPDENAPENWFDYGSGLAANAVTGEVQDDQGNTVGWLSTQDPLTEDGSGLEQRDPNDPGTSDYLPPIDVATGPGFLGGLLGGIGDFLGGLLGGNADGRTPGSSGAGGGSMGGGGSSSGSQQQALQKAQQQLAAAQGANANPNVIAALQAQIRALQGGGSSSSLQTVLLLGAIAGAVYLVTRNNRAA